MAKKGIVFLTINYRLGIFGFLTHPALSKESPHHVSGNYAMLDQIAALQWVKQNIAAFGGDPQYVTIDGQSAGSCSVNTLVASPLVHGLFHRAIAESGAFFKQDLLLTLQQAEQEGLRTLPNSPDEMRALTAEELLNDHHGRLPVVDGYLLPDQVNNIFMRGQENEVDLLTDYNTGEAYLQHGVISAADFIKYARKKYGSQADAFLKFYPAHNNEEAEQSQRYLSRELIFARQHIDWAKWQTDIFIILPGCLRATLIMAPFIPQKSAMPYTRCTNGTNLSPIGIGT
jgi:para-nitrobenzyl esterase